MRMGQPLLLDIVNKGSRGGAEINPATLERVWTQQADSRHGTGTMAKYTRQDVKALAQLMRAAKDEGKPFAILNGAGCSLAAGIPDAPGLLRKLNAENFSDVLRHRLNCNHLCDCDYGDVMGQLPMADRKAFLEPILAAAKVNWGYIALATLMRRGFVGHVLTFNFDSVLARAAGICGLYPAIYDFGVAPADNLKHLVSPCIIHLHGQGHGAIMMNTAQETEAHAKKLRPLLKHTFENSGLLVIGYSGTSDKVFPYLKETFENEHWLYWCDFAEHEAAQHVKDLLDKAPTTTSLLAGVDFDEFMIDLAQELATFPPDIFAKPAEHLLAEIAEIKEPPATLTAAADIFLKLKTKLAKWKDNDDPNLADMQSDLLAGQPKRAQERVKLPLSRSSSLSQILALAEIMQGNELVYLARLESNNESLFHQAFSKYEAALKIKPDNHLALDSWSNALLYLYRSGKDSGLLVEASAKALRAEELSGKANYNLACAFALQNREEDCQQQLLRCKADGTLPDAAHLQTDKDLEAYRAKDWFKELTVE